MASELSSVGPGTSDECRPERIRQAVEDFQRGVKKEGSFEILFRCNYRRLQRFFARQRVFSPEEREDLTQDTLWRVYKGLGRFRGQASFTTWLYGIAKNNVRRWRERQTKASKRFPEVFIDTVDDLDRLLSDEEVPFRVSGPGNPAEELQLQERDQRLVQEIGNLPERMRRCVELRIEGLRYREIAEVMQIDRGAVGAHLAQAKSKLKAALEGT